MTNDVTFVGAACLPCGVFILLVLAVVFQCQCLFSVLQRYLGTEVVFRIEVPDGCRKLALTIDDSPTQALSGILDVLRAHNVRATFFIISGHVERADSDVQRIIERLVLEGHELCNHGAEDHKAARRLALLKDHNLELPISIEN